MIPALLLKRKRREKESGITTILARLPHQPSANALPWLSLLLTVESIALVVAVAYASLSLNHWPGGEYVKYRTYAQL